MILVWFLIRSYLCSIVMVPAFHLCLCMLWNVMWFDSLHSRYRLPLTAFIDPCVIIWMLGKIVYGCTGLSRHYITLLGEWERLYSPVNLCNSRYLPVGPVPLYSTVQLYTGVGLFADVHSSQTPVSLRWYYSQHSEGHYHLQHLVDAFPDSIPIPDLTRHSFDLLSFCIKSIPNDPSVSRLRLGKARSHTFLAQYVLVCLSSLPIYLFPSCPLYILYVSSFTTLHSFPLPHP